MKLKFKTLIASAHLLTSFYALAIDTCKDPFETLNAHFLLQGKIGCEIPDPKMDLRITSTREPGYQPIGDSSYYLDADCSENTKVMTVKFDASKGEVIDWGSQIDENEAHFMITHICKDKSIAGLDTRSKILKINNTDVEVSFTAYKDEFFQDLILYVLESESRGWNITFRSANGEVAAIAAKTAVHEGTRLCYANWIVHNRETDPTLLSYIVAWKENSDLICTHPVPVDPKDNSHASAIAASFIIVGGSVLGAGILWYYRHKLNFSHGGYETVN